MILQLSLYEQVGPQEKGEPRLLCFMHSKTQGPRKNPNKTFSLLDTMMRHCNLRFTLKFYETVSSTQPTSKHQSQTTATKNSLCKNKFLKTYISHCLNFSSLLNMDKVLLE